MKEVILIKETEQLKGAFSELILETIDPITVSKQSTVSVNLPFDFQPANLNSVGMSWSLAKELAIKGVVLNGVFPTGKGSVDVVITNTSDKKVNIHNDTELVCVTFFSKNLIKAVPSTDGVIDLGFKL